MTKWKDVTSGGHQILWREEIKEGERKGWSFGRVSAYCEYDSIWNERGQNTDSPEFDLIPAEPEITLHTDELQARVSKLEEEEKRTNDWCVRTNEQLHLMSDRIRMLEQDRESRRGRLSFSRADILEASKNTDYFISDEALQDLCDELGLE